MSIEKSLYTRTVVPENKKPYTPPLSKTYRGVSSVGNPAGSFVLYDLALIKQDIINHFHVRQGERLERPEFGSIIWDLLFDPLTEDVKALIVQNVTQIINLNIFIMNLCISYVVPHSLLEVLLSIDHR